MPWDRRGTQAPPHRFPLQTANKKPLRQRRLVPSDEHCPSSPKAAKPRGPEVNAARVRDSWWSNPSVNFPLGERTLGHLSALFNSQRYTCCSPEQSKLHHVISKRHPQKRSSKE